MKLFITLIFVLLTGCGTITKDVIVYKNTNVLITPPDSLIVNCGITQPPNKENYLKSVAVDKEKILSEYIRNLLDDAGKCNAHIDIIRQWIVDKTKIYKTN